MKRSVLVLAMVFAPSAIAADGPSVEMEIDLIATASRDQMGLMAEEAEKIVADAEAAIQKLASAKGGTAGESGDECTPERSADRLDTVARLKAQAAAAADKMRSALDAPDLERAASELRKLAVAANESLALADAEERCAVGVTESTGRSRVTTSGGVGDPDADTAKNENNVLDIATDSTSASPF